MGARFMDIFKKRLARTVGGFFFLGILLIGLVFFLYGNYKDVYKIISLGRPFKGAEINIENAYNKGNIVPFLVLGSGPASLAAALYGARTKIRTVVLKGAKPGGQLTETSYIENWPGIRKIRGSEVVKDCEEQAARFGALMVSESAESVDLTEWPYKVVTSDGTTLQAMAIFIGTGANARFLGIPGERNYWGKGVTNCAICDAPYHKGDVVVVIGAGDSAVEESLELSSYAREVRMLVRSETLKASPSMLERLEDCDNVKIIFNTSLTEIKGAEGKVSSVVTINNKTKVKEEWPEVKGVFLAIGHTPNTALFKDQIKLDGNGYIELKERNQYTSAPGVFAAGDVSDPRYKQAGVAAGDGIKGGLDAVWWLSEIGYNGNIEKKLEPFLYEPYLQNMIKVKQANSEVELNTIMKESDHELIVLDFFTLFCPACMHMMPVAEWVGTKLKDKVLFVKIDASIAFDLVKKYEAPKVPHFVVIKNKQIIARSDDVMDRAQMLAFVNQYL
jgi:thioredoxin reductase (NADPH)